MKNLLKHLQKLNEEDVQVQISGNISTMIEMESFDGEYEEKKECQNGIEYEAPYIILRDDLNEEICEIWLRVDDIIEWSDLTFDGETRIEFENGNVVCLIR